MTDDQSYEALRVYLYADSTIDAAVGYARELKQRHDNGEIIIRLWLDGYFWFPRGLMGIERHLFAFYDQYDKMVMSKGEAAMRAEFERLLPVMQSGGFVPSVDHQTPPGVSLENYRIYVQLFREYCKRAVWGWV